MSSLAFTFTFASLTLPAFILASTALSRMLPNRMGAAGVLDERRLHRTFDLTATLALALAFTTLVLAGFAHLVARDRKWRRSQLGEGGLPRLSNYECADANPQFRTHDVFL